ncbi:MAG: CoA transferase [Pseudomonadales bacterium]|jgi:crotonobetainyl-CoA:carnitine CoA-transferase CaiB-like acyl-CoA transferase|nr:CoA transferase [Pseudomonadales bacterium]MDP7594539.1 CoA transferase [Pseudomonadales bacterium]HJN50741.1 CoA transferase [Pseudomonadales bacterium]|tara:strand:+ start:245 stop:1426 length:1182 start_codon:yes stop_codon:yes gene_type:complete
MATTEGALAGVHILDLTDERGIYGAKLLADLGADVVRPEPPGGDPLRQRGPHRQGVADGSTSLWHAFFASSRRFFAVDPTTPEGAEQLRRLVERSDIVLTCDGSFGTAAVDLDTARKQQPELVVVDTSSFGPNGPWRDYLAPDLVAGALGGACATTGDVDTTPLKAFGELNFMVSGAYVAIAALGALYNVRQTESGQQVDVPVHECIASCLEHVFMWTWYGDDLAHAEGPSLPRRGSLHWSNAYVVMQAVSGSIMVTPAPDPQALILWLVQEEAHEDLLDEKWLEPENLLAYTERLMQLVRDWVAKQDVEELFFEAQSRHCPFGWVLPIEKVALNPQLEARQWWVPYRAGTVETRGPGAPYRFTETPCSLGSYGEPGADSAAILADIGWEDAS